MQAKGTLSIHIELRRRKLYLSCRCEQFTSTTWVYSEKRKFGYIRRARNEHTLDVYRRIRINAKALHE